MGDTTVATEDAPQAGGVPPHVLEQLAVQLDRIEARQEQMAQQFDASAEQIDAALRWVVATITELKAGGISALLRGQRGRSR